MFQKKKNHNFRKMKIKKRMIKMNFLALNLTSILTNRLKAKTINDD